MQTYLSSVVKAAMHKWGVVRIKPKTAFGNFELAATRASACVKSIILSIGSFLLKTEESFTGFQKAFQPKVEFCIVCEK